MKKTLAIFLALIMILSVALVACKSNTTQKSSDNEDDDTNDFIAQTKNDGSDTSDTSDDDDDDKPVSAWITNGIPSTVYTMASVNIRSDMSSSSSTIVATVAPETPLSVVAQSAEEDDYDVPLWYKVSYEGTDRYVSGAWVSSNVNDAKFEDCSPEVLVIKDSGVANSPYQVNLRSLPAVTASTVVKTLTHKEATSTGELTKVGASASGLWFKVKYDTNGDGDVDDDADICYIKMTSAIRGYFGLTTNSGSTGNG